MKVTIYCVGQVKEPFYRDAIAEFTKRLSAYCKLGFVEVQDEKTPDGQSDHLNQQILEKEASRLLSRIKDSTYVICLAINGKQMDSVSFSKYLMNLQTTGKSDIAFVIGGSLGLHSSILSRADFKLSFSNLTFPHQLMRVILLEQVYRAYRIMNHEPYHK